MDKILLMWLAMLVGGVFVYLVCNTNFAIIFTKAIKHQDIRQMGSGNPGTTNVVRTFGLKLGVMTFVCDMFKGVLAAVLGLYALGIVFPENYLPETMAYFLGMCAVLGHIFPVFLKFKGGKGVATSIGFFLVVNFFATAIALIAGLLILILFDKMSVFSVLFITLQLIIAVIVRLPEATGIFDIFFVFVIWGCVMYSHRMNLKRLFAGQENPAGVRKYFIKDKKPKDSE